VDDDPGRGRAEWARGLLQRDFAATAPNEEWVSDITYLRTWNGFVYLAFILECYSRTIVGWQLATAIAAPSTPASPAPTASTSSGSHPRRYILLVLTLRR
jgi:transposase InsO family protein